MDSKCTRCGEPLRPGDRFCSSCGTAASVTAPGVPAVAQPVPGQDPWTAVVARLREAVKGEFEILRELGRGGMAAVYLAHEIALNRKVAIKLMSPGLISGEGMVRRFRQEAVTIANMSHPHIITIHAVRQIEDLHFFVMKFVEGRSLEHIVRSAGPLPIATVRFVVWMVGNALAYAHKRGVVHRDVKPANILVDDDGNAVVTDFGIAKLVAGDFGALRTSQGGAGQTQTGMVVGTPNYMSPEQCLARQVSAASDQYSLGLVTYEMLTGHPPFTGSPFLVMQAHTERLAQPIREQRPDCPPEVEGAVLRMLAKVPEQRWPSVQHALAAIGAAPLGDGDPARLDLVRLAMPQPFRHSDEVLSGTPSPVPLSAPDQPRPYVAAVEIFAPPKLVEVGDRFTLSASARNPSGDTMASARVRWSSGDEGIATVDEAQGVVEAIAPGTVEITARSSGVTNSVFVTVTTETVRSVILSPAPDRVDLGLPFTLYGAGMSGRGNRLERSVAWRSDSPKVATVDQNGVVLPVAPGEARIVANVDGVESTTTFTVNAPPALVMPDQPLSATEAMELEEVRRMLAERDSGRRAETPPDQGKPEPTAVLGALLESIGGLREKLAPILRRRAIAIGSAAAVLLIVVAWIATRSIGDSPVPGQQKADSLDASLVALARAGVEPPTDSSALTKQSADSSTSSRRTDSAAGRIATPPASRRVAPSPTANTTQARAPAAPVPTQQAGASPKVSAPTYAPTSGTLPRSAVARLTVTGMPNELHAGDTVRVLVMPVDERGSVVNGSVVRWSSVRPEIATVDAGGLISARRAGAGEIVATSEGKNVRLQLSVLPPRPPDARDLPRLMLNQMDDFVSALARRDVSTATTLYAVQSLQDRRNLDWLVDKMRRPEAKLGVSQQQVATPQVGSSEAMLEVRLRIVWTLSNGRSREVQALFRARYSREGEIWLWKGIRALGSLES